MTSNLCQCHAGSLGGRKTGSALESPVVLGCKISYSAMHTRVEADPCPELLVPGGGLEVRGRGSEVLPCQRTAVAEAGTAGTPGAEENGYKWFPVIKQGHVFDLKDKRLLYLEFL